MLSDLGFFVFLDYPQSLYKSLEKLVWVLTKDKGQLKVLL